MAPSKPPKGKSPAKKDDEKNKKNTSKSKSKTAAEENPSMPEAGSSSQEEDDSDSDNGGVDEQGMERLMKALGDDGLDEFDQVQLNAALGDEEGWEDEEEDEGGEDEDEDEEDVDAAEGVVLSDESDSEEEEGEEEEEEEEALVALDDEETGSVDADAIPQQKLQVDNEVALARIRESIQLDPSIPWTETLVLSYPHTIDVDVDDDLNRELAFYKQALHGAQEAQKLAAQHKFPFTRPSDYFAEMVKSDAHMERIRQRLLDERAGIKKAEEKRKERENKKFGKQVQVEKLKERERSKKEMEERLKGLKRKRKDILDDNKGQDDDAFDIAVEDAISDKRPPAKRSRPEGDKKFSRQARDKKFGFGGHGRRAKQNTRVSTDDFDFGSRKGAGGGGKGKGGKGGGKGGGSKRPGKSRRMAARSR